jgi:hypothetical protein
VSIVHESYTGGLQPSKMGPKCTSLVAVFLPTPTCIPFPPHLDYNPSPRLTVPRLVSPYMCHSYLVLRLPLGLPSLRQLCLMFILVMFIKSTTHPYFFLFWKHFFRASVWSNKDPRLPARGRSTWGQLAVSHVRVLRGQPTFYSYVVSWGRDGELYQSHFWALEENMTRKKTQERPS